MSAVAQSCQKACKTVEEPKKGLKRPAETEEAAVAPAAKRYRINVPGRIFDSITGWFMKKLSDGAEAAGKQSLPIVCEDSFAKAEAKAKVFEADEYKGSPSMDEKLVVKTQLPQDEVDVDEDDF
mmetsp:Transcript_73940/g.130618  ORF Transcript_73940/g.130618 Transcript_73940/m.130618 type:complete len:124 (-) Transcript_73940:68-439(-)|eukprot:CAMPEP_0197646684 /NCGR_PEP_ID=MMETSP1338-20131121/23793_1 /TAXON_ID=43686 ORGANISM="Pelagodinium beii, Strain RCC1491" /NCGR_SAMPLE_ID=MMETSP1338 /ASSEMBLY_ACC=CAM_ASM_000754 /LENGTH=123 /DNA_ID=CAMNT_0043220339 /DNA_START=62 /DNA_END=433 /DNA_ORIENTATION=-